MFSTWPLSVHNAGTFIGLETGDAFGGTRLVELWDLAPKRKLSLSTRLLIEFDVNYRSVLPTVVYPRASLFS